MSALVRPDASRPSPSLATEPANRQAEVERRLLKEANFLYAVEDWEVTHDDLTDLAEQMALDENYQGGVVEVGRLVSLSSIYAVNVPVSYDDDGNPEEWEVMAYPTKAEAEAAFAAAAGSRHPVASDGEVQPKAERPNQEGEA